MSLPPTDTCDYYALARHLNHNICFNFIFFFNVIEILEYKTTLIARTDFFDIIFKSLKGSQLTFIDLLLVSGDAYLASSLEGTVKHIASCDSTDTGSLEQLTNLCMADYLLLEYRIQHTLHGSFHVLNCLVDNTVQTKIYAFLLCQLFRCGIRTNVESDDDRI